MKKSVWNKGRSMKDYPQCGFQKGHGLINGGCVGKHWKVKDTSNYTGENGFKKAEYCEEDNWNWKGENASVDSKHIWIRNHYGNPPCCEDCGEEGYYIIKSNRAKQWTIQWSNCDHKYRRLREDYNGRCVKCHRKYDKSQGFKIY